MTYEPGQVVRTLLEVRADSGAIVPPNTRGTVLGWQGNEIVVEFEDRDTGTKVTAILDVWEVRR